ncbi:hypothetical protein A9Q99_20540 [Gammaproteobacteria bacterium 45_16_T64]|nr:hypothetical protein A9Q99_20540 [Gammaproteobacteria bacterium 45_16_T64]
MAKTKLSLLAVSAASVLGLSACVQQLWTATYPGPNNYYSEVYDIVVGTNNNVIIEGRTKAPDNSDTLFVAQYNSQGSLLWDYSIPNYVALRENTAGTSSLRTVNNGNVFASGANIDGQSWKILTLSSEGELLWEKDFSFDSQWKDIAVSREGIYYLLGWFENRALVMAFDEQGNDLWEYEVNAIAPDDSSVNLPNLGSRLINGFSAGHMEVAVDGRIVVNVGETLFILNSDGSLNDSISAIELGVDFFLDHSISEHNIALLGTESSVDGINGNTIAFILNAELAVIDSAEIGKPIDSGSIAMLGESSACVSFVTGYTGSVTQALAMISMTEEEWGFETTAEYAFYSPVSLKTDDKHCYLSTSESLISPTLTSYTYRYDVTGKLVDTIALEDFGLAAIELSGSDVYSGGITGNYDGIEGTTATIVKHKIR